MIELPLFRGFSTSYAIAEADVQLRNAEQAVRRVELETTEQVRVGLIDLRNAYLAHRIEVQALELASERLRIAREEYRLAGRDFESLQAAIRDAAGARRRELDARYGFVMARIDLREATGLPVVPPNVSRP